MRMLKQKLRDFVDARIGARLDHRIAGLANTEFLGNLPLFGPHGVMLSTATLSPEEKARRAIYWQYRERARIALSVAGNYRGGDYLEFGSDGMGTFRNFLSAYDLNGLDRHFPQTRFYAFDIFGRVDSREMDEYERTYFGHWEGEDKREQAHAFLDQHNLFRNRCEVHAGFFTDTVPPILERYRGVDAEKIGFAFLDCNITTSYEFLFGLLPPCVNSHGFIYMDEYYENQDVPGLFREFVAELERTRGFGVEFVRNAGVFGALFRFMAKGGFQFMGNGK